jgi:phosphoribosyl 1,2-cyclic phosphodiesterase
VARQTGSEVYINKSTWDAARRRPGVDIERAPAVHFEAGQELQFGPLSVRTFSVSHDAADPVAFVVSFEGYRVGIATDLGHATRLVEERLAGCDVLVLESNHDLAMLESGPYPWDLKRRIKGKEGHLSNDQCAALLRKLSHPGLAHVVLAHLSQENNQPATARQAALSAVTGRGLVPRVTVASQNVPVPIRLANPVPEVIT